MIEWALKHLKTPRHLNGLLHLWFLFPIESLVWFVVHMWNGHKLSVKMCRWEPFVLSIRLTAGLLCNPNNSIRLRGKIARNWNPSSLFVASLVFGLKAQEFSIGRKKHLWEMRMPIGLWYFSISYWAVIKRTQQETNRLYLATLAVKVCVWKIKAT